MNVLYLPFTTINIHLMVMLIFYACNFSSICSGASWVYTKTRTYNIRGNFNSHGKNK